jgi:hypothetical protein
MLRKIFVIATIAFVLTSTLASPGLAQSTTPANKKQAAKRSAGYAVLYSAPGAQAGCGDVFTTRALASFESNALKQIGYSATVLKATQDLKARFAGKQGCIAGQVYAVISQVGGYRCVEAVQGEEAANWYAQQIQSSVKNVRVINWPWNDDLRRAGTCTKASSK